MVTLHKIIWQDASGGSNVGWRDIDELKQKTTAKAISCGVIVHEDDTTVIICPHVLVENNEPVQGDAELAIPQSWIISKEALLPFPPGD